MSYFVWDFYQKEQEKKEEMRRKNDIALINQNLQRILKRIEQKIDKNAYEKETEKANEQLDRTNIWNLGYINNLENPNVSVLQALFIRSIVEKENFENKQYYLDETERFMRQLGNIEWEKYLEYKERSAK